MNFERNQESQIQDSPLLHLSPFESLSEWSRAGAKAIASRIADSVMFHKDLFHTCLEERFIYPIANKLELDSLVNQNPITQG